MSESSIEVGGGQLQDFTIDQFAGATALILGSFGGLLMIIWKSRCACRMRVGCSDKCYIFDCERSPPPDDKDSDDEETSKKGKDKDKDKKKKDKKKKKEPVEVEEEVEEEALVPQNDDDVP
tara:strand:+ start:309 stop:671 length:363 start_codon:yes stop_codon:yes gene_type:complete